MSAIQYSWQKLDGDRWGVKAAGDLGSTPRLQGRTVTVTARSGKQKQVTLGRRVDTWNGGRASVYEVA